MATQLQIRRGTTAQMNAFTGAEGELAVNTSTDTVHVHDGATAGGFALAKADGSNIGTYAGSFTTISASGAITGNVTGNLTGSVTGNVTGDVTGDLTGSVLTAAQTNITSVGTLSTLAVTGTATAGSLLTTGAIASTAVDGTVVDRSGNTSRFVAGRAGGNYAGLEMHVAGASGVTKRFSIDYDSTTKLFAPNGTSEHLVVTSAGRVGIGTSSPSYQLDLKQADTYAASFENPSDDSKLLLGEVSGDWRLAATYGSTGSFKPITFWTSDQKRLTIDTSGNVGIGTSSPRSVTNYSVVGINGTSGSAIDFELGEALKTSLTQSAGQFEINVVPALPLIFKTSNTERMRIDASGNLMVGKTAAADNTVGAYILADGAISCARPNAANDFSSYILYSTGASAYRFYVGMGGTISAVNTTINGISDVRYKENIRDLDDGLAKVMQLQPRKFDWKEGKGSGIKGDRGFIAQEFEEVFPDLISEWKDPAPEGEEPYKAVRADLIPTLVKAIQELKEELNTATARITELENN